MAINQSQEARTARLIAALQLAENAQTEGEADAAREHAERLALRYGIDQAQLDEARRRSGGHATEEIIEKRIVVKGIYSAALLSLGFDIASALGLQGLQANRHGVADRVFFAIGYESDVALFETLYASLQLQALTEMNRFWKTYPDRDWLTKNEAFREKRQFVMSFGHRVGRRLAELHKEEVDATPGAGIVLVDRATRVRLWNEQHNAEALARKGRDYGNGGSWRARDAGRAAGDRADVGQAAVRNTTRELAR